MMNLQQRIEAMDRLAQHIGEYVSVTYINQHSEQESIRGILKRVTPFSNVEVAHLTRVPEEIQHMDVFQGRKIFKSTTGIPFLGEPDAIMSIIGKDGKVLYDNEHVHPSYNPHFLPNVDEAGRLRIGDNYEAGKAHTEKNRELSFGRQ